MIPRVAHMIWLGGELPPHLAKLVASFRVHHPRWKIRWWHEKELEEFGLTNAELFHSADQIVAADSVYQLQSDIARYEILHRHGGLYVDCDYRWQRPLDPHLRRRTLVSGWEAQYRWVANGIIAATPRHPALAQAIKDIPERIRNRHPSWRANRLTGPHLWTPIARRHAHILHQRLLNPVPWHNPERADEPHPNAVAVHLWNHQRTLRGIA